MLIRFTILAKVQKLHVIHHAYIHDVWKSITHMYTCNLPPADEDPSWLVTPAGEDCPVDYGSMAQVQCQRAVQDSEIAGAWVADTSVSGTPLNDPSKPRGCFAEEVSFTSADIVTKVYFNGHPTASNAGAAQLICQGTSLFNCDLRSIVYVKYTVLRVAHCS